jgi:hypothetical protein
MFDAHGYQDVTKIIIYENVRFRTEDVRFRYSYSRAFRDGCFIFKTLH